MMFERVERGASRAFKYSISELVLFAKVVASLERLLIYYTQCFRFHS